MRFPIDNRRRALLVHPPFVRASVFSVFLALWVAMLSGLQSAPAQQTPQTTPSAVIHPAKATLDTFCVGCHNTALKTGGLALDTADITNPARNADVWERVLVKLHARSMPPAGRPRPDSAGYGVMTTWLESEIDSAASANPNPGR